MIVISWLSPPAFISAHEPFVTIFSPLAEGSDRVAFGIQPVSTHHNNEGWMGDPEKLFTKASKQVCDSRVTSFTHHAALAVGIRTAALQHPNWDEWALSWLCHAQKTALIEQNLSAKSLSQDSTFYHRLLSFSPKTEAQRQELSPVWDAEPLQMGRDEEEEHFPDPPEPRGNLLHCCTPATLLNNFIHQLQVKLQRDCQHWFRGLWNPHDFIFYWLRISG